MKRWPGARIFALYASVPAQADAYREILTGKYWWSFLLVHLLLGAALPFAIFALRGSSPRWLGVAVFLAAAGVFSVRLNAVIPGQVIPQLEGLPETFVDPRLTTSYFPSGLEWLVTAFITSIAVALFYAGYQLFIAGPPTRPSSSEFFPGVASAASPEGVTSHVRSAIHLLFSWHQPARLHQGFGLPGRGGGCRDARPLAHRRLHGFALQSAFAERRIRPGKPENIIYTVCQQCNTQRGIKAKIQDGTVVKIDGNPFSPWTAQPHVSMRTDPVTPNMCLTDPVGASAVFHDTWVKLIKV